MLDYLLAFVAAIRVLFRSRASTALEVLALRQQIAVLKTKTTEASFEFVRPAVLDWFPAFLFWLEKHAAHRQAGQSGCLAPGWLSLVLAMAISLAHGRTEDHE